MSSRGEEIGTDRKPEEAACILFYRLQGEHGTVDALISDCERINFYCASLGPALQFVVIRLGNPGALTPSLGNLFQGSNYQGQYI